MHRPFDGASAPSGSNAAASPGSHFSRPGVVILRVPRVVDRPALGRRWVFASTLRLLLRTRPPAPTVFLFEEMQADVLAAAVEWPRAEGVGLALALRSAAVGQLERPRWWTGRVARPGWSLLRELERAEVEMVARGHHGVRLDRVPPEIGFHDLLRGRRELGRRLGAEPVTCLYDHAPVDDGTRDLVERAGFLYAVVPGPGGVPGDRLRLGSSPLGPLTGGLQRAAAAGASTVTSLQRSSTTS